MRHEDINELVSAYLDGEADDPAMVEELIREEPQARSIYNAYKQQREILRSLKYPKSKTDIAIQVTASLTTGHPSKGKMNWLLWPVAIAACAAFVIWIVSNPSTNQNNSETYTSLTTESIWTPTNLQRLESDVIDAIADNPETLDYFAEQYPDYSAEDTPDPWLSAAMPILENMNRELEKTENIAALIQSLNESETIIFKQLLYEYTQTEG